MSTRPDPQRDLPRPPSDEPHRSSWTRFGPSVTFTAILCVLGFVALAAGGIIVGACEWGEGCDLHSFRLEVAKSGLQVLVVVVIGGLVTFLTGSFKNALDRARVDHELCKDVYRRLVGVYRSVKLLRRHLRIRLNEAPTDVAPRDVMLQLESVQLDLEQLIWELPMLTIFDVAERARVTPLLREMEGYLRVVLENWETHPTTPSSQLTATVAFVGPSRREGGFHGGFVVPYAQVRNAMRSTLRTSGVT